MSISPPPRVYISCHVSSTPPTCPVLPESSACAYHCTIPAAVLSTSANISGSTSPAAAALCAQCVAKRPVTASSNRWQQRSSLFAAELIPEPEPPLPVTPAETLFARCPNASFHQRRHPETKLYTEGIDTGSAIPIPSSRCWARSKVACTTAVDTPVWQK